MAAAQHRLSISLVPPQLWGVNLRKMLTKTEWNRIRAAAFEASAVCTACGAEAVGAARHAHEEWEYELAPRRKAGSATLVAVRTLCRTCHFVQHPGFVSRMVVEGNFPPQILTDLERHFCKVNRCNADAYRKHLADAQAQFDEYLKVKKWSVDFGAYAGLVGERMSRVGAARQAASARIEPPRAVGTLKPRAGTTPSVRRSGFGRGSAATAKA